MKPSTTLIVLMVCLRCFDCRPDGEKSEKTAVDDNESHDGDENEAAKPPVPCSCGIFLSGQLPKKHATNEQPKGNPVLVQETDNHYLKGPAGNRMCITKCLEVIIKHLPKSDNIICASLDRDCKKEKAYLFVQNHDTKWINSKMSQGKEYCCKDNKPYKC